MPRPDQLPDGIRPLRSRQAVDLHHRTFSADADVLVRAVRQPGRLVTIVRLLARRPALLVTSAVVVALVVTGAVVVRGWGGGDGCVAVHDDFATGSLDTRWTRTNDAGGTRTFASGAGRLVVTRARTCEPTCRAG